MNKETIRTADFHIFIEFRPWFCLGGKSFAKALTAHPNPSRKREGRDRELIRHLCVLIFRLIGGAALYRDNFICSYWFCLVK
jgi:hypothetical protein